MAWRIETRVEMLSEYRMQHRPASPEYGAPLYDLTAGGLYPDDEIGGFYSDDVYSSDAVRLYGQGGLEYAGVDQEIHALIVAARGKPDYPVRIYRSIPNGVEPVIHPGDWVTPSKRYADLHGTSILGDQLDHQVAEMTVPAKSLYTDGNSWVEWGYWPS